MNVIANRDFFQKNFVIFEQGDFGEQAYFIEEGKIELSHKVEGKKEVVDVISKGAMFGEMALIAGKTRLLTATVLEAATCRVITPAYMEEKISESSPFIQALLRVITGTVQNLQKEKNNKE